MPHKLFPAPGISFFAALLLVLGASCTPPPPAAEAPLPDRVGETAAADAWQIPEIGPGEAISRAEYAERRRALAAQMGEGVLVVPGAAEPAADYLPYAQNAPFQYLTGIEEPGAALVIVREGGSVQEHLYVMERRPEREIWEGAMLGTEGARQRTGIAARTNDRLIAELDALLDRHDVLYTVIDVPEAVTGIRTLSHEQQILLRALGDRPGLEVRSLGDALSRLRAAKSPTELDLIRRAVYISVLAHREAMRAIQPGMNEFEIRGLVEYIFLRNGADGPAYASIVGSGPNATTLHYRDADRFMRAGELLLMDVGASYRGYAADVTRTFPVDGSFTPEQGEIYEIVLEAQKAAEERLVRGARWDELNRAANDVITRGLARVGLIDAPDATYVCDQPTTGAECPQYRLFYMHGLGHGIGLQVHDPDISYYEPFQPGSAVTIEPGIYVRSDVFDYLPDVPANREMVERLRPAFERYRDIGVRLEDDYIFDENGVERATAGVPREIDEVEALMRESSPLAERRRPEVVEWYRETEPR